MQHSMWQKPSQFILIGWAVCKPLHFPCGQLCILLKTGANSKMSEAYKQKKKQHRGRHMYEALLVFWKSCTFNSGTCCEVSSLFLHQIAHRHTMTIKLMRACSVCMIMGDSHGNRISDTNQCVNYCDPSTADWVLALVSNRRPISLQWTLNKWDCF